MGPHASPLRAHPPSIPRPGTLSQPQPTRRAAATQARTAAGPKAQGVGGGRGGAAAAEAAAAPEVLAKRLRRPRAESALPVRRCARPEGQQLDLVLPHPQLWKTASPDGAQRCARRRPAADRLIVFVQFVTSVDLGQVESRYGSGAAMAKWVGEAAMTAAAVVGLSRGSRSSRSSGEKSRSRKVTISTRGSRAAMAGDGGGGGLVAEGEGEPEVETRRRAEAGQRWRRGGGRRRAGGGDAAEGGGGPKGGREQPGSRATRRRARARR